MVGRVSVIIQTTQLVEDIVNFVDSPAHFQHLLGQVRCQGKIGVILSLAHPQIKHQIVETEANHLHPLASFLIGLPG